MKPIETGVEEAGPLDALALRDAAGSRDALEQICPYQFPLPAAPNMAAEHAQRSIDLARIRETFAALRSRHDVMVAEGAGGLMVPILPDFDMGDLAADLGLPLLLVARTALGTINHTLLTLSEIERRGLELVGVVLCHSSGPLSVADDANLMHLRRALEGRIVGELPALRVGELPAHDAIDIEQLERHLNRS